MAIPEIKKRAISSGFIRGGVEAPILLDEWRYQVDFVGGPCAPAHSYPNRQSVCETTEDNPIIDLERLGVYDPKPVNDTYIVSGFRPWPIHEIESCERDDVVRPADRERVVVQLDNHRSSLFAEEFSDGLYSGSPSLRSVGVPVSNVAVSPLRAVYSLLQARIDAGVAGPHIIHIPLAFRPFFEDVNIVSNDDYRIVYDTYAKSYVPTQPVSGGGSATAPGVNEGWIAVTGGYEYAFSDIVIDDVATIEDLRRNTKMVKAEQQLFYRFETCGVFLAKVAVFSS